MCKDIAETINSGGGINKQLIKCYKIIGCKNNTAKNIKNIKAASERRGSESGRRTVMRWSRILWEGGLLQSIGIDAQALQQRLILWRLFLSILGYAKIPFR